MPFLKKVEWNVHLEESNVDDDNIRKMKLSISDKKGNRLGGLEITDYGVTWHKDRDTRKPEEPFNNRQFGWDKFINMIETHKFATKTAQRAIKRKI